MTAESTTPEPPAALDELTLDRSVTVRTGRDRFRTDATVRDHAMVLDEPPDLGGADLGPTPFDLLCASLGACTTITLRMYADRKGWPLEEVTARVEYRGATRRSEGGTGIGSFLVEVELQGRLDAAQRERLLEIAGRCPVHRALVAGSEVEVRGAGREVEPAVLD